MAVIGPWQGHSVWYVSAGEPIVPAPQMVTVDRMLREPLVVRRHAAETTIAEEEVTILECRIMSTRWRDHVDILQLCKRGFDPFALYQAAETAGKPLEPVGQLLMDYGAIGQAKSAAWRRRGGIGSSQ